VYKGEEHQFFLKLWGRGREKKHTARCDALIWAKMTDFWVKNGFVVKNDLKKRFERRKISVKSPVFVQYAI